jgi:hypothetical protein
MAGQTGVLVLGLIAIAGVVVWLVRSAQRGREMRSLAERIGFNYLSSTLPGSLTLPDNPFSKVSSVWNVIDGERNGVRVVAFDFRIYWGSQLSWVRTAVAVRTPRSDLKGLFFGDFIASRSGDWAVCYQPIGSGMVRPGLMSVSEIEAVIRSF